MCPPAGNFIGVIVQILILLGAVGLFLFGMKTMSEALQKLSGHRLRNMLTTMAGSPVHGIVASTAITALVQSSSAVTVMIVSFVNAGMLHLTQAIAMVMGANIGTTVTAWLVVLFGISFDIDLAAVPLIAFAAPLLLLRSERLRNLGNTLIGLALMLLAIHILRDAVTHFSTLSSFENYITLLRGHGHWSPLLFVLAGAAMTAVLQSSSATTALAIILCSTGVIPFKCAMALILGDNVGTTLTANIAATMTNTDGKRAALSHLLFNLVGVLWALPLLAVLARGIASLVAAFGGVSPLLNGSPSQAVALALFHTLFNVVNTLLLAGFIPQAAHALDRLIPGDRHAKRTSPLEGSALVSTSEMGLYQARENLALCMKRGGELTARVKTYFGEVNADNAQELFLLVRQRSDEEQTAYKQLEQQLARLTQQELSQEGRLLVQAMNQLLTQLRAATWLSVTAAQVIRRKKERNIWFTQPMREDLGVYFSIIQEAYFITHNNLTSDREGLPQREDRRIRMQAFLEEFSVSLEEKYLNPDDEQETHYQAAVIFAELTSCIGRLAMCVLKIAEGTAQLEQDHQ